MLSPFECLCGNFILPEPASYVFFYAVFNLRNLLYLIRMRLKYLKEHRRVTYINLKTSGQLTHYLNETDREANEMLRLLIEQMAQAQGITEQLKDEDQMAWVGAMNSIRSIAEETVMQGIIFAGIVG